MNDVARLFQQQVPLDSKVKLFLTNGKEVVGTLDEISRDRITLRNNGNASTIFFSLIGGWEVLGDIPSQTPDPSEESGDEVVVTEELQITNEYFEEIDTHQQIPIPAPPENTETVLSSSNDLELYTKIIEINAQFQAHLQTSRININPPDFIFPKEESQQLIQEVDTKKIWDRVVNKYSYALKVNELSTAHGRIQVIISDLEELSRRLPVSFGVNKHLGYLYYLSGQKQKATEYYRRAATISTAGQDWHNLAVTALESGQKELACYSLERFFRESSIIENFDAWYIFIRLLLNFSSYYSLKSLSEIILKRNIEQEIKFFVDTLVYLLKATSKEGAAKEVIQHQVEKTQSIESIVSNVFENFEKQPSESYQKFLTELDLTTQSEVVSPPSETLQQYQGYIYAYKNTHKGKFGWLRSQEGKEYFFHHSAVVDKDLLPKLENLLIGQEVSVTFQLGQGPKGDTIAVSISAFRTVDEMFRLATRYASEGEYHKAIAQIKKVLATEPNNLKAQNLHEKWREYARVTGVPQGTNPYDRAKRVQLIEKDLERAEKLFRLAIKEKDNWESAVKDLAMLLDQLGRTEEAIELLKKHRGAASDKQSVDNLLTALYIKAKSYDQAITLLIDKVQRARTPAQKTPLLWQIGNAYLRQEQYIQAEQNFREILRLQRNNQAAERNLAICLFKQERLDEAEKILNHILDTSSDTKAAELLDAIKQVKQTGQSTRIDEIIIELTLSDLYLSGEVSRFTQFFLDRCQFEGVKPERVQTQEFVRSDIRQLEDLATKLGTSRPRQRASYYLSAAAIVSILDEGSESNQFYKYLGRCFASMGDAAVVESKHLNSAQDLYCESLAVYDGDRTKHKRVEQDASNALVRFLYSTLGQTQIPIKPDIPTVNDTLDFILANHPEKDKAFDAIAYLVSRSRYAANLILNRLFDKEYSLRAMALEYLKNQGVYTPKPITSLGVFVQLWDELRRKNFDELRKVSSEIRFISGLEFTTASLEVRIERIKRLSDGLFFELDQRRLKQTQNILETAFDLCQQEKFTDQERLAEQIERTCQELLGEIESNPTKISVEELFPVIQTIKEKTVKWKEELYKKSVPDLSLHLPIEAYIPDRNLLKVQVSVSNRAGCSPAEALELITRQDKNSFTVAKGEIKLYSSLEGGDSEIIEIPLQVTEQAISSQAFSLPLCARYRTRSGDTVETPEYNFSIRLSSAKDFEEIHNPYAPYAESGIVEDAGMFYGREELIQNIAQTIQQAKAKSVVIYGQKRAGKSSILYHLKKKLQTNKKLLVLDWGNIGSVRDKHAQTPLLYQILWGIVEKLDFAVQDKVDEGLTVLSLPLPTSSKDFYSHPDPLTYFKEIFERYKRQVAKLSDWHNVRIVLLIDEFTYIYDWIIKNEIADTFMKNWKALLQENYFSAVLVGQDYMPKFKLRFPNEFGTTQDERVTYLRKEDAVRLIDEPIRIGGKQGESRYREQAIDTVFNLTAGSPFYLQIVCNRLVEYMNRKRAKFVTEADVKQVKNELISGVNALDIGKFDNLINSGDTSADAISDQDALKVLTTIALNSRTGSCARSSIACTTRTPIDEILRDLVNREVVEQRDQNYRIRVELFKEWLMAHPVR